MTTIAVDFDGTLVTHDFPRIGRAVPGAFEWLQKFQEAGATLILWTMRSDGDAHGDVLTDAVNFCREHGVEFDSVNSNPQDWTTSPKIYADIYIDDRAFGCPLRRLRRDGAPPYVWWQIVGPAVLQQIRDESLSDSDWDLAGEEIQNSMDDLDAQGVDYAEVLEDYADDPLSLNFVLGLLNDDDDDEDGAPVEADATGTFLHDPASGLPKPGDGYPRQTGSQS